MVDIQSLRIRVHYKREVWQEVAGKIAGSGCWKITSSTKTTNQRKLVKGQGYELSKPGPSDTLPPGGLGQHTSSSKPRTPSTALPTVQSVQMPEHMSDILIQSTSRSNQTDHTEKIWSSRSTSGRWPYTYVSDFLRTIYLFSALHKLQSTLSVRNILFTAFKVTILH